MDCRKVCGSAGLGIWVLKGEPRGRTLPANLDHLSVRWRKWGSCDTAWVTTGHDCLCSYAHGHGAAVGLQTSPSIWDGVIGLWGRVTPLLSPLCAKGEFPSGENLNRYPVLGSFIPCHCDNKPLFGAQSSPKPIVSMSLVCSVEFQVRRRAPWCCALFHFLVMNSLGQSEHMRRTVPELHFPQVNLTFRFHVGWGLTWRCYWLKW